MTEFNYIGISKRQSLTFGKYSYLLSYGLSESGKLITGKRLVYGYLTKSFTAGAPRGWFIGDISMDKRDFEECFQLIAGIKRVKI